MTFAAVVLAACAFSSACASGGSSSECGDGKCEGDEDRFSCPQDCVTAFCGNSIIETGEECDGQEMGGATCQSMGFESGTLSCTATCQLDASSCQAGESCGDGQVDAGEECDGLDFGGQSCESLGFSGGSLGCLGNCTLDTSGCDSPPSCGNGQVEAGEECDGADLNGATCVSLGFAGGTLSCTAGCTFDTSGCDIPSDCGNGQIDSGEECDGGSLGGESCQGLGFVGGVLACDSSCMFDTSGCEEAVCGDGVVEGGEECDGSNLAGMDCTDMGFAAGTLACASCQLDTSGCVNQSCTLTEGFESGVMPPTGWEVVQYNITETWAIGDYDPASGLYYAHVEYDPNLGVQDEVLISPTVVCSNMTLTFWISGSYHWCVEQGNYDVALWVVIGDWGGGDDILITNTLLADLGAFNNWQWYQTSYSVPTSADNRAIRFAWQYHGADAAEFLLDDIQLIH